MSMTAISTETTALADFISEAMREKIASDGLPDVIINQDVDGFTYVDLDQGGVFLVTVREGKVVQA